MPRTRASRIQRLGMAAQNALELIRFGRLSRTAYSAPYDVVHGTEHYKLRHYRSTSEAPPAGAPLLLVPPLMVAAEVYDMSADVSAVTALVQRGIDVWLVDFGAPEHQDGGLARTLDDHIRAIDDAIEQVRARRQRDVHLAGYSQGGMFAYQTAAYRKSNGLRSLITFGSPVNIHRSLPNVDDAITDRLIAGLRAVINKPLKRLDGLSGTLSSTAFKALSLRKEVEQISDFVRKLHDRQALIKRESRRVFLGGDGFVAWPGPAFRKFVDEFIVHNRMVSGGIVIDGRTVTLADIRIPILYFVGLRDDMARPAAVRGIAAAAPYARRHELALKAGHFGLVVGSQSQAITWPTVAQWVQWQDGLGARPEHLPPEHLPADDDMEQLGDIPIDIELFYDVLKSAGQTLWNRLGDTVKDLGSAVGDMRVQIPHLNRLRSITGDTPISASLILAEQASAIPDQTFFLWRERAFNYADANRRVDNVVRGLLACGIEPGQRVGVLMHSRPSHLTIMTAVNRLGAVAVLISPLVSQLNRKRAIDIAALAALVTDPENVLPGRRAFTGPILVLGGGRRARAQLKHTIETTSGLQDGDDVVGELVDLETIDPDAVAVPSWYRPDPGRAHDLATIIFSPGPGGQPRPAYVSNWRWAFSAFGAAATATLSSRDTVYCCLPLHHAAGTMVAAGSALVGGSRLALATPFEPEKFWHQVRRYGATVVYYAGEMCRPLVDLPADAADTRHPVRLFAGSGMRADVWRRMIARHGDVSVLEFYASTEGNAVLANVAGQKIGSIGQPIPGSAELALVRYDFVGRDFVRDLSGALIRCQPGEPGVLLARLDNILPAGSAAGDQRRTRMLRAVFASDDTWYVTNAVARQDRDGDYFFIDRLSEVVVIRDAPVFTRAVEDILYRLDSVAQAVVYGLKVPRSRSDGDSDADSDSDILVAALVTRDGKPLAARDLNDLAGKYLDSRIRPKYVRLVASIAMTDGYRPLKSVLRSQRIQADEADETLCWDENLSGYRPCSADDAPVSMRVSEAQSDEIS